MDATHHFRAGSFPLLISIPHHGSRIPPEMAATMTADGRSSRDTDWFLERLYDLPETEDASWLVADWSRYVIDLNRPASGESLYPGQTTTGLVPTTCFDGANIYLDKGPSEAEVAERISQYWAPYHQQLQIEVNRLRGLHPRVVLLEAHSIASVVPRLFPGKLPDWNLGTNRGASCDPTLLTAVEQAITQHSDFTQVSNGRFVGGYITREYGNPSQEIHTLQIELSQATYLNEDTLQWNQEKALAAQQVLRSILQAIRTWLSTDDLAM